LRKIVFVQPQSVLDGNMPELPLHTAGFDSVGRESTQANGRQVIKCLYAHEAQQFVYFDGYLTIGKLLIYLRRYHVQQIGQIYNLTQCQYNFTLCQASSYRRLARE